MICGSPDILRGRFSEMVKGDLIFPNVSTATSIRLKGIFQLTEGAAKEIPPPNFRISSKISHNKKSSRLLFIYDIIWIHDTYIT